MLALRCCDVPHFENAKRLGNARVTLLPFRRGLRVSAIFRALPVSGIRRANVIVGVPSREPGAIA